jgi:pyruvate/2-oxoglutarate dehydrogenase complex dihydrolipoamide dehydrogenase (E3) component
MRTLQDQTPGSTVIVGGGYIGLEMAEALTTRGLAVVQMEQLPEVPTVDPALGALVHAELAAHGVEVLTRTTVRQIARAAPGWPARLRVDATTAPPPTSRAGSPGRTRSGATGSSPAASAPRS